MVEQNELPGILKSRTSFQFIMLGYLDLNSYSSFKSNICSIQNLKASAVDDKMFLEK